MPIRCGRGAPSCARTADERAESGGERAAAMYSLIGSARLNGIDPEAYLHHVIERIAHHPINRIDELLPLNVVPLLPATARTAPVH